eukprot:TRINITY_DN11966_c0_g1::TRINITY_DN11966_c0_g1_i1::g.17002::m.17002 TRINITY_DN11966_c0_g1::TRINITY_DN11966_c0_g1_i1::g.17002  ORF type:complete len:255 (+),score=31.56,sp/Q54DA1/NC2A_DICDI/56.82/5e-27,CBFD_NFYB_HMF/PF00808.18/2.8e-19,Histone/PF00125.19/1e-06,TAFII28/PF04719.9/0.032,TAF4/PF05236.9/0.076,CENP-X/PF09415.5/0.11,Pol_alpha_B_N/PF08418.5/0.11,DUF4569/PF15133.1/0.19,PAT1/PF09770.4/0.33,DUF605/PF04652.11/1.4,Senescence_reg/PF04520.8/1.5e+02 TRINITY_DN11966_c0_g1_i1:136-900(+)
MGRNKYQTKFPVARIKRIMQTDDQVGKIASAVPILVSKCVELFMNDLVLKAADIAADRKAKTLTPGHLKACILGNAEFDFLTEHVQHVVDVAETAPKKRKGREEGEEGSTPLKTPAPRKPRKEKAAASAAAAASNSGASTTAPAAPSPQDSQSPAQQQRPPQVDQSSLPGITLMGQQQPPQQIPSGYPQNMNMYNMSIPGLPQGLGGYMGANQSAPAPYNIPGISMNMTSASADNNGSSEEDDFDADDDDFDAE